MDLAVAQAARVGADLVIANDPDADRLAVAVFDPSVGDWRRLHGDEVGCLLAHHLLSTGAGDDGREPLVVCSIVSSTLLGRIAEEFGAHYERTLTGFKWLVRPAFAHPEWRFVLGYEEALGYSVGELVRDKDGITAALVFADLAASLKAAGQSVVDRLAWLDERYGRYRTAQRSFRMAPDEQAVVMAKVRAGVPAAIGDLAVRSVADLAPGADVVIVELDGGRVVVRPSGTEPKLKLYLETVGGDVGTLATAAATWLGIASH